LVIRSKHFELSNGEFATILEVRGSIDSSTERQLRRHLDDLVRAGARHIVFDGKHVPYINSTGLGTILMYMDKLQELGGNLVLTQLSDKALMVIEMLGFAPALDIVDDQASAVEVLGSN
jgi:anti-anti-sigma factor